MPKICGMPKLSTLKFSMRCHMDYKIFLANSFEWDGVKIDSPSIDRNHKYQDEVIITEYLKQNDCDATDGFKVRSNKSSRIYPEKTTALYIQDNKVLSWQ